MKGFKHCFVRECKKHNVKITVGDRWQCKGHEIIVPMQYTDYSTFVGFHELAHAILHSNDKRNYDDLWTRIAIEREADSLAYHMLSVNNLPTCANPATLGLIALYIYQGGSLESFTITIEDRFIILSRYGVEIFSQFISNLPMHPVVS